MQVTQRQIDIARLAAPPTKPRNLARDRAALIIKLRQDGYPSLAAVLHRLYTKGDPANGAGNAADTD